MGKKVGCFKFAFCFFFLINYTEFLFAKDVKY